jgi:hypothetical protein
MSDELDILDFNHEADPHQDEDSQNFDATLGFDETAGDHSNEIFEIPDDLTPSHEELHYLENLEEHSHQPDHPNGHHEISLGDSDKVSCSDCSGSCAAYCASLFK